VTYFNRHLLSPDYQLQKIQESVTGEERLIINAVRESVSDDNVQKTNYSIRRLVVINNSVANSVMDVLTNHNIEFGTVFTSN